MSAHPRRPKRRLWAWVAVALVLVGGLVAGALVWKTELSELARMWTGDAGLPDGDYPASLPLGTPVSSDYPSTMPLGEPLVSEDQNLEPSDGHEDHGHSHGGDDLGHEAHDESMLSLSAAAEKNLGITAFVVERQIYEVTESIPAFVAERPGRTRFKLPAPTTGVVTEVAVVPGQIIRPGQRLFTLRLTHEDLVDAQTALLQTTEQLDVVAQEIARLESVGEGVVARKQVLEQQYEQQKLLAIQRAQKQRLALLGFDEDQVVEILDQRRLLSTLTVTAPDRPGLDGEEDIPYHLRSLDVQPGESVAIGQSLAELADYRTLYIEGLAFEDDAPALIQAQKNNWPVTAVFSPGGTARSATEGLQIVYLSDAVDRESRALKFYVELPNERLAVTDGRSEGDPQFMTWKFRPGQQVELRVPVELVRGQIVVPIEAVAYEGAETYVFVRHEDSHGPHYDRTAVHVVSRDQRVAVLDPDGPIREGDTIAAKGAYQMQLALKNAAGGGVDPHAGHSH